MMENEYLLRTVADIMNAAPRTQEEENEYRQGYSDGFIAAVNLLADLHFLKSIDRISEAMYDHWEYALQEWQRGAEYLPPTLPRKALCVYCGAPAEHMDHVIPRSRGGRTTQSNLVPACARCNYEKGAQTPEEWRGGADVQHG